MIVVECQWITFDDWLFEEDNDTLRLARLLECRAWIGRPTWSPYEDIPPSEDYLWLPLYIETFGKEIVHMYGCTLTLYACGELCACKLISPLPSFAPIFRLQSHSMRIRGYLNFSSVHNRSIRDR